MWHHLPKKYCWSQLKEHITQSKESFFDFSFKLESEVKSINYQLPKAMKGFFYKYIFMSASLSIVTCRIWWTNSKIKIGYMSRIVKHGRRAIWEGDVVYGTLSKFPNYDIWRQGCTCICHVLLRIKNLWPVKLTSNTCGMLVWSIGWEQPYSLAPPQFLRPNWARTNDHATLQSRYVNCPIFLPR